VKPFAGVTTKCSGTRIVFSRFATAEEAEAMATWLRWLLGPAEVERIAGQPGETVQRGPC
jgi:hypothetical protein